MIEAKKEGTTLSIVADQTDNYAENLPEYLDANIRPSFRYESTGIETFFRDSCDPHPRSRRVFTFHRPETLGEWASQPNTLRQRLAQMLAAHPLITTGLRECQIEAITGLEKSFADERPRALIHMATGAGKTYTACAFIYRLIKWAGSKRVLFLVDRSNLGEQARDEFAKFRTPDTGRLFSELYNVQHLTSSHIDDVSRVTICTIQRLYSILRGEELSEEADEHSGAEFAKAMGSTRTKDVVYNATVPIEEFDFIVTDECHRSIYNLWRQVLEYFDSFLIGLTATPAPQTIAYFHQNRVAEYGHERAVADGVNVGYDVYRIKTRVTEKGGSVEKGLLIDHRSKASRAMRQQLLDNDLDYTPEELDRSVVVPDQIRTILTAYRDAVFTELFPGRTLLPKTLIFAKDDSHAEDIVDKTESRPLDRQPTVPLKTLLQRVIFPGGRDEDTITTLAARLARLDRELDPDQRKRITDVSGGHTPATLASALLRACDPDAIAERAMGDPTAEAEYVAPDVLEAARQQLIAEASAPFDKTALRETLENLKRATEQAMDIYTPDEVLSQGFDAAAKERAAGLVQAFRDYLGAHQAEIDALQILYSRPYKQRLTEPMLKELEKKLREAHAAWTEDRLWDAYAVTAPDKVRGRSQAGRFADLVSLVRFALEQQPVLAPFADSVQERYEQRLRRKEESGIVFTSEQRLWLGLIRDHIATSLSIEPQDFDYTPFTQRGGLGKAHQLFGPELPRLLDELNEALAA